MIRSFLITVLLVLNFQTLLANDELSLQLGTFNKNVATAGAVNYLENCSKCGPELNQTSSLYSPKNKKSVELSVLSPERALDVFNKLKNDEDIPFIYPMDGCYARAHKMAMVMDEMGIISGKAFLEGNLFVDTKYGEAGWSYHVASLVMIKKNGKLIPTIIDPGLFDKPVPYEEWKNLLLKKPHAKYENEYFTKRFNYDPDSRHDNLTDYREEEIDNMNETNRMNRRSGEMLEMSQRLDAKGSKK